MDPLKEPKEEPLFDDYNENSQSFVGERNIKEEEKSDDEESHFAMSSFFTLAGFDFPRSMAPEPADPVKEEEIDPLTESEKKCKKKRQIERIDWKHMDSPVDGEIVLRTNGRPSRRVSRTVKYNESLVDLNGDEASPVKKLRSESGMIGKKINSSIQGSSQSDSAMKETKMAKLNGTELECPECEYRSRSVGGWEAHLRSIHSTTVKQAGLALRCECGVDCFSNKHFRTCKSGNVTVIKIDDKKESQLVKINDSELKCPNCEFRTKSVNGWMLHLRRIHSLTPCQAGLTLRCDCGHEGSSAYHSRTCDSTNTTAICYKPETPQCIMCEDFPKTPRGYIEHLDRHHKTTLKEKEIYLKCYCTFKVITRNYRLTNHNKECDGHQFTVHKINEE